jgi:Tfp pilus assembly PilM family ATPase
MTFMLPLSSKRNKRSTIGLDIGAIGARAAQIVRTEATKRDERPLYTVTAAGVSGQMGGATNSFNIVDAARDVRRCLMLDSFQGRRVCVLVGPPALEVHSLELPKAVLSGVGGNGDVSSVSQVVQWEMQRLCHGSAEGAESGHAMIADVEMRHWTLPATTVSAPNVMGVALPARKVDQVMSICKMTDLRCERIDVGAISVARMGALLKDWRDDEAWGVVDFGVEGTRLMLCVDRVPVLVRTIGPGGGAWTRRIAETLQISHRSAEVHKCDCGLMPPGTRIARKDIDRVAGGSTEPPHDAIASIVFGALRADLKSMATEIKRSYEYVLSCYPGRRAADLVLLGGGAEMKNLTVYLGDALGIPVRRVRDYLSEPTCRLVVNDEHMAHVEVLASAIGAAIQDECEVAAPRP